MLNIWQRGKGVDFQFHFWWNDEPGFLLSHAFFFNFLLNSCLFQGILLQTMDVDWKEDISLMFAQNSVDLFK